MADRLKSMEIIKVIDQLIRNHEPDEIPEDVWDICIKLMNMTDIM